MVLVCAETHLSHTDRPSRQTAVIPAKLYSTFFTSSAENLAAFCRLTISSSFGCLHVPVVGVDGADCATGVEGRAGVDMVEESCASDSRSATRLPMVDEVVRPES